MPILAPKAIFHKLVYQIYSIVTYLKETPLSTSSNLLAQTFEFFQLRSELLELDMPENHRWSTLMITMSKKIDTMHFGDEKGVER